MNLIEKQDRPKRITKTAVGKEANCLSLLLIKLDKLPETAMVLEQIVETTEQFAVRRIQWATHYLNENQIPVTFWNLVEKACVYKLKNNSMIQKALNKEISCDKN